VIYPWVSEGGGGGGRHKTGPARHSRVGADGAIGSRSESQTLAYEPAPVAELMPTPAHIAIDLAGNAEEWVEPVYAEAKC